MTAHATLSAEARDRIVRLLEIDAQQDGSARQDLREFQRFVSSVSTECPSCGATASSPSPVNSRVVLAELRAGKRIL